MATLGSIQRGVATLSSTLTVVTVAVTSVDTAKTILLFDTAGAGNSRPDSELVRGQLTSATQIDFTRVANATLGTLTTEIAWQLITFTSGVSVQRGTSSLSTTLEIALTPVNPAKSFPLLSWATAGSGYSGDDAAMGRLTTSATLHIQQVVAAATGNVDWQVVEYDNCSVQQGSFSLTTAATAFTVSLSVTVCTDRSLLLLGANYSGTMTAARAGIKGNLSSTAIEFSRDATGNLVIVQWHVVSFTDAEVRAGIAEFGSLSTVVSVTLSPTISTGRAVYIDPFQGQLSGTSSNNTDDNMQTSSVWGSLSSTGLVLTRGGSGPALSVPWFVAYWPETGGTTYDGTLTDTVVLSDAVTVSATLTTTLTESVVLAETVTATATLEAAVSDTVALADDITVSATLAPTLTESVALADDITVSATLAPDFTESVVLADDIQGGFITTGTLVEDVVLAFDVAATLAEVDTVIGRRVRRYRRRKYWPEPVASPTLKPFAPPEPAPTFTLSKMLPKDKPYQPVRIDLSKLDRAIERLAEEDDEDAFLLLF